MNGKERLHHLIDEIQEAEAMDILDYAETLKTHNENGLTHRNEMSKVEMDPDVDDEVWMYVC